MQKIDVFLGKNSGPEMPPKAVVHRVLSRRAAGPTPTPPAVDPASLPAFSFVALSADYLDDCVIISHSAASLSNKRVRLGNRHGS